MSFTCYQNMSLTRSYSWQAIKVFDVLQNIFASDATTYYGRKWLIVDCAYITILSQLRIPRLKYSRAVVLLQILSIWFLDGMLFGGISLNLGLMGSSEISSAPSGIPSKFARSSCF
jgi:nucleoporin POM152